MGPARLPDRAERAGDRPVALLRRLERQGRAEASGDDRLSRNSRRGALLHAQRGGRGASLPAVRPGRRAHQGRHWQGCHGDDGAAQLRG